jgi:hypothetical protein
MTDYLQRLVQRLNQPSTGDPPQPTPISPFVPTAAAGTGPEDPIEEVNDSTLEDTAFFKPAPVEGGIDQPQRLEVRLPPYENVTQPAETTFSTPPRTTRNTAELIPNPVSVTAEVSSTRGSGRPSAKPSESDDYPLIETERLTRTVLVETEIKNTSAPDSISTPSDLPVSGQPGESNQDEKEMRQEEKAPRALETRKEPIETIFREPLTEPIERKRKQSLEDPTTQPRKVPVQSEPTPPSPAVQPKEIPTLYPSPQPAPLETPQPERPRLVIGRLVVEVVPPPKASQPASSTARPARRISPRTQSRQPTHSKLRFGLGQL